jgi:predicted RNase H-like HicB family nuclease
MEYHAVIERTDDWWIGWLVDLAGVNAQERTREELLESLRVGAQDMLNLKGVHDSLVTILASPAQREENRPSPASTFP